MYSYAVTVSNTDIIYISVNVTTWNVHMQKIVCRVLCTMTVLGVHPLLVFAPDIRSQPLLISVVIQLVCSSIMLKV